jgi:hypothetical protein
MNDALRDAQAAPQCAPSPLRGEGWGEGGPATMSWMRGNAPSPDFSLRSKSTSPHRGEVGAVPWRAVRYTPSGRIGGRNASPVSQGKKIQVSCDTSVMKVSTIGRPIGLA